MYVIGTDSDAYVTLFNGTGTPEPGADRVVFSVQKGVQAATDFTTAAILNGTWAAGTLLFRFQNGGVQLLPCHEACNTINPLTDPTMDAARRGLIARARPTYVDQGSGALLYMQPPLLPELNTWTTVPVDYAPEPTTGARLAAFNDVSLKFLLHSPESRPGETWMFRIVSKSWHNITIQNAPARNQHTLVGRPVRLLSPILPRSLAPSDHPASRLLLRHDESRLFMISHHRECLQVK